MLMIDEQFSDFQCNVRMLQCAKDAYIKKGLSKDQNITQTWGLAALTWAHPHVGTQ